MVILGPYQSFVCVCAERGRKILRIKNCWVKYAVNDGVNVFVVVVV